MVKVSAVTGDLLLKVGIGIGLTVIALVLLKRTGGVAADVAKTIGTAINPASPDNIVNRTGSAIGAAITGDKDWTLDNFLGGIAYRFVYNDPMEVMAKREREKKEREAAAEMQREARRGRMDSDVLTPSTIYDQFGNEIYPYP